VLESFAARVPVVATAVGGTPEAVEDGVSGYLVPPGQPAALAGRLVDLLGSDGLRRRMGICGYRHVCAHFSFEAQARGYLELFENLAPCRMAGTVPMPSRELQPVRARGA
jgi:L-malate glycosyltransferase